MLGSKTIVLGTVIAIAVGTLNSVSNAWTGEGTAYHTNEAATQQVGAVTLVSLQLVDEAIVVLSQGWSGMSQAEQETFLLLYDPAQTGDVDAQYVAQVLGNYHKVRKTLAADIEVVYAPESDNCIGQRLYFTDLSKLYVCPYFFAETNELRKARTLIHEMAHIALLVTDRAYYRPTSKQYAELTPNGSWMTELPLAGKIVREVLRGDTLYHPDAYAHFALMNAGHTNIWAG